MVVVARLPLMHQLQVGRQRLCDFLNVNMVLKLINGPKTVIVLGLVHTVQVEFVVIMAEDPNYLVMLLLDMGGLKIK